MHRAVAVFIGGYGDLHIGEIHEGPPSRAAARFMRENARVVHAAKSGKYFDEKEAHAACTALVPVYLLSGAEARRQIPQGRPDAGEDVFARRMRGMNAASGEGQVLAGVFLRILVFNMARVFAASSSVTVFCPTTQVSIPEAVLLRSIMASI